MSRKEVAEESFRNKFGEVGLSARFEFLGRDWASDHGRKVKVKCKACGNEFFTWSFHEIIRGRADRMVCPECGASSNGEELWTRTRMAKEMEKYYISGHSVKETAEKFGLSTVKVNNYVKHRQLTNGKNWREEARKSNQKRKEETERKYSKRLKNKGIVYFKKYGGNIRTRAKRHGCDIGVVPSLKRVFALYDGKCCICGKQCSFDSKAGNGIGKDYPTRGHIIPSSNGGELDIKNLWLVCNECNYTHGTEDETHFLSEGGWTWDETQMKYVQRHTSEVLYG